MQNMDGENGVMMKNLEKMMRKMQSDYTKILYIDSEDKLLNLPIQKNCIIKSWKCLDFEELLKNYYDAIEVDISKCWALYNELYGWDCDSILIMNPDIIREIKTVGQKPYCFYFFYI